MRTSVGRAHVSANTRKRTITPELSRAGFEFWFKQLPLGRMPGLSVLVCSPVEWVSYLETFVDVRRLERDHGACKKRALWAAHSRCSVSIPPPSVFWVLDFLPPEVSYSHWVYTPEIPLNPFNDLPPQNTHTQRTDWATQPGNCLPDTGNMPSEKLNRTKPANKNHF